MALVLWAHIRDLRPRADQSRIAELEREVLGIGEAPVPMRREQTPLNYTQVFVYPGMVLPKEPT